MTYVPMYPVMNGVNTQLALLIRFFRDRKAVDEQGAVSMTNLDWAEVGIFNGSKNANWKKYNNFIKSTSEDKYWLDVTALEQYRQEQKSKLKRFFTTLASIILACGLISFIIFSMDPKSRDTRNLIAAFFLVGSGVFFILIRDKVTDQWIP